MSLIRLLAKKNQVATSAEPVEEVENIEQPSVEWRACFNSVFLNFIIIFANYLFVRCSFDFFFE